MNESRHTSGGIDSAFDEAAIKTVSAKILKLAFVIITYITSHRNELTDSYCGLIMNAAENINNGTNHLTLKGYSDYILNITFSYAGRTHYDDIQRIVTEFGREHIVFE